MSGPGEAVGNLPSATASFIGRGADLRAVRLQLRRARLVTITGAGGVGKTRLALEAARGLGAAFPDGVWFVDLSAVADPSRVAQALASTIGVLDTSARPPEDRLTGHLADRTSLLVVDNCEHVLATCAATLERVLRAAPGVRVLATSRESLEIAGEGVHLLGSLSGDEAVRLLEERVTTMRADLLATDDDRAAAARLCARLDGNPLAIELAATRLRTLSLRQLLTRLDDRFAVLNAGSRTAMPRQQTLRALIDWSHGLCSPPERLLWARLSVFTGSFDLEAAERICSGDGLDERDVLDLLDRLVARSVVVCEHDSGAPRFRMLETIRAYGRHQLGAAAERRLRARHLRFYVGRAQAIADAWCGPDQKAHLALLRADHDNLRLALESSFAAGDGAVALELTAALRHHWCSDGFLAEGRRWLDRALDAGLEGPRAARTQALWVAAWAALLQGDRAAALARLEECAALPAPGAQTLAHVRMLHGTQALFAGELDVAVDRFRQAIATARRARADAAMLSASFQLGHALAQLGELEAADRVCRDGLAVSEDHGEQWARSCLLWTLGYVAWLRGDLAAAERHDRRSLQLQRGFHDGVLTALTIELAAWIAASRGDVTRAAELLAASESVWGEMGTSIAAFGPGHSAHHELCIRRVGRARRRARRLTIAEALDAALAGDAHAAAPAPGALTPREWEVAQLVAAGMTNRAIASQLVVSHRTVDGHLEHILAKLGFHSRAQVAAWTAERRPGRPAQEG